MWKMKTLCWMTLVVDYPAMKVAVWLQKTRQARAVSFLFLCLLLAACSRQSNELDSFLISGETMGTFYHITLVTGPEAAEVDTEALKREIDGELRKINQMMSTYIPDSDLMQFNRAPVNEWVELPEPLLEVFTISRAVSDKTGGAFDITVAPLVDLWGFGPQMRPQQVPSEEELQSAMQNVGYRLLEVEGSRARRLADIRVDLSAVAKGYGVDWVSAYLHERGYRNHMVDIGGEVRVNGVSPRGDQWRIAIERPGLLHEGAFTAVTLDNQAVATSGDYRNYFEEAGVRYSHTLDPKTGKPIRHNLVSVTVIAETTADADAWATALNVLGPEAGIAIANAEQMAVYMIVKTDDGFEGVPSTAFVRFEAR